MPHKWNSTAADVATPVVILECGSTHFATGLGLDLKPGKRDEKGDISDIEVLLLGVGIGLAPPRDGADSLPESDPVRLTLARDIMGLSCPKTFSMENLKAPPGLPPPDLVETFLPNGCSKSLSSSARTQYSP